MTQDMIEPDLLIDDFEQGVPFMLDEYGNSLGYVTWGDTRENVVLSATQIIPNSRLALPDASNTANTVLTVSYDINSWGGFTHAFTDGENWTTQDWTAYNAITFWFYGAATGSTIQIDIFDNRNTDSTGDSAERWYYRFEDTSEGWRQITIPFDLFQRRTDFQPGGAPNDGFGLDAVSGYAFIFPAATQVSHLDNVGLTTVEDTSEVIIVGETETDMTDETVVVDDITWDSREWTLIWSDEFEGEAGTPVDESNWTSEIGGEGWGNNELQFYTDTTDNAALDGEGNLVITAQVDDTESRDCHYGVCEYTSARLITEDKFEFTYGRVEARIKIPRGQGIWPAFWMLGGDFREVGWPMSGEMDIMENIGREPRTTHGTVHGPGYSGENGIGQAFGDYDADVADDFHIYAIDWDEDAIRWYVDGNLFNTLTPQDLNGREWVFDHDFFILLNVAVGGNWPGYPDDTSEFPQTMLVDYVRVYQLANDE